MDFQRDSAPVGRLAPSPTGLLHLGNAWSFLLAWLGVRAHPSGAGRLILRQEDIDPARSRREWMDGIERDEIKINVVGVNHFTWLTRERIKENAALPTAFRQFWEETGYV